MVRLKRTYLFIIDRQKLVSRSHKWFSLLNKLHVRKKYQHHCFNQREIHVKHCKKIPRDLLINHSNATSKTKQVRKLSNLGWTLSNYISRKILLCWKIILWNYICVILYKGRAKKGGKKKDFWHIYVCKDYKLEYKLLILVWVWWSGEKQVFCEAITRPRWSDLFNVPSASSKLVAFKWSWFFTSILGFLH